MEPFEFERAQRILGELKNIAYKKNNVSNQSIRKMMNHGNSINKALFLEKRTGITH
ncbi:hypothetical protein [Enterococcus durans]|uniref:hypothetical protein n=1 Tax=Enterococcus durans TaxID=53345 RepID=UPI002072E90A|nr:hypothetical protein [Enterococcus durans]